MITNDAGRVNHNCWRPFVGAHNLVQGLDHLWVVAAALAAAAAVKVHERLWLWFDVIKIETGRECLAGMCPHT